MVTEIIGGAFVSSLFEKLFDKLGSSVYVNFFREAKVNARLLKKLQITLLSAEQLHAHAEAKQFGNPSLRKWLFELKDAIMAAEELLDEINYETLRYESETRSGSGSGSSFGKRLKLSVSAFSRSFDEEIEEVRDSLEHVMKQKEFYGIKGGVNKERNLLRLPAPLAEESRVYGRNDAKEKIVSELVSNDSDGENVSVIPIVGMGGIGKTTLAQLVYEDDRVRNCFGIRAWVTVSDEFDVAKITRMILEDISNKKYEYERLDQIRRKLIEELAEKKFLIVLDDVWNEKYELWDVLKSHFKSGTHGSKIIVTTRSDVVAKVMGSVETHELGELSEDDCWRLFRDHVFGDAKSDLHKELHEIGREIVKKCKGLPLAVKALAGLLRSSTADQEEWRTVLANDIWELQLQETTSNNILPSLWLSYYYLPSHLKRCFTYCSIFPKDYAITEHEKEKIKLLWMAEGLLQPNQQGKRSIDVGEEYFRDLISRSLFQRSNKGNSNITMHDRVHDLAVFLSGEFSLRLDDIDYTKFSTKTRHFSYSRVGNFANFGGFSVANGLRTCIRLPLSANWPEYQPSVPEGRRLRALRLSSTKAIPCLSSGLKLLRYLDLSCTEIEQIPNTLCSFYYLQTLELSNCQRLTELPTDTGNLVYLCHLGIKNVPLRKMPLRMHNLKDLQTMCQFVLGKIDCSSIKELGGLHYLSGKLAILNLQNVDNARDVWEANLKDKKYLNKIEYQWSSDDGAGDSQKERNVLDALQPHKNLVEIIISGYSGKELSNWVGHSSYVNLVNVKIIMCNSYFLPCFGQLPCLQDLSISQCHNVVVIDGKKFHECASKIRPFPSLKSLKFEDMSAWRDWLFLEGQETGGCFTSLEKLCISGCPKLNIFFSECFPSLKTLDIQGNKHSSGFLPENRPMSVAFPSLERLVLDECPRIRELFMLGNFLPNTTELHFLGYSHNIPFWTVQSPLALSIGGCENVTKFPETHLSATVTSICITGLRNLKALNAEGFRRLSSLKNLEIEDCHELECFLPGDALLMSLTSIRISRLPSLKYLCESIRDLTYVEELDISSCGSLEKLAREEDGESFRRLTALKKLSIWKCEKLQRLLEAGLPTSLVSLCIVDFRSLEDLSLMGLRRLVALEHLQIGFCKNLRSLPEDGLPPSLLSLHIEGCPLLEPRCRRETGQDWHKIAHIPSLKIGTF